jgi:hypothetical protein
MTIALRQFVNRVADRAAAMFKKQGHILPMYHAVDGLGNELIFASPHSDKDVAVAMVRGILKACEATRVAYLDEAWLLDARGEDALNIDMAKINREGVRNQPGRIEVVLISAEDQKEGLILASREIIRHGDKAVLGKLKFSMEEGPKDGTPSFEGRMVGLLPSPKVKN